MPTRVTPIQHTAAYNQVKPTLDRNLGGSYKLRPDTMSSTAKSTGKWLFFASIIFAALYAIYSFFNRRPPGSSQPQAVNGEREERWDPILVNRIKPPETAFKEDIELSVTMFVVERDIPVTIYNPAQAKPNDQVLMSYQRAAVIVNHTGGHEVLTCMLNSLMTAMGSSDTFKELIKNNNKQAISQLVDFIIDTFGEYIPSYPEMPAIANDKDLVKANILKIYNRKQR